ncbi:MAG: acetolactate synthase small subunit [Lentisphaerae bacterium]|nr:acetolactate synthase small subunit [Lentisphaerota bacterium]MCP4100221.1 acetolactate synthase small subunit [Lentisphaerota bacterium]
MGTVELHTISVLVENKFGVLARVAGLFSGRGYNIKSLTVNETDKPNVSKMTIVTTGDEAVLEQIDKQLNKLVEVLSVEDLTGSKFIERELALIKVNANNAEQRSQVIQLVEVFGGKIVSVNENELGVELAGRSEKIDNFISLVNDFGVVELARSGRVAISRKPGATQIA